MLRDDGAVAELLLACGSSGEAREALDVLSAADGEGEAARSPSALYRWRTLALRACGAGPFGAEARTLLEQIRQDAAGAEGMGIDA